MVIREADKQDFQAICGLIRNELGYSELNDPETIKRLEYFDVHEDWVTFVALDGGEVVGFVGIMKGMAYNIEGYYSEIVALAVSEKARRKGIGTALMIQAETWAYAQGVHEVGLHSNLRRIEAHEFYEKIGYMKKSYWFYKKLEE